MFKSLLFGLMTLALAAILSGRTSGTVFGIDGQAVRQVLQGATPSNHNLTAPVVGVEIRALDSTTGRLVGLTKTGADGKYVLNLPPGKYRLEANYGLDWILDQEVQIINRRDKIKSVFRYIGKVYPPSTLPSLAKPTVIEFDLNNPPSSFTLSVGDVIHFVGAAQTRVMTRVDSHDESVLSSQPSPVGAQTKQGVAYNVQVVARFVANKIGTTVVTITIRNSQGGCHLQTRMSVTVAVR